MQTSTHWKQRWTTALAGVLLLAGGFAGGWLLRQVDLRPTPSASTSGPASTHGAAHTPLVMPAAPRTEASEELEVRIAPELLERIRLSYATVTEGASITQVRVPGKARPNLYKEVKVVPLVGGAVTLVAAELGQNVQRGQALVQIFSRDLAEAQAAFLAFRAQLEVEHKKLMRTQELARLGAASKQELEAVEGDHDVHAAHVEEARQRLLLLGLDEAAIERVAARQPVSSTITVPSPIDGVVTARNVNTGQVVAQEQELFVVTDLSAVWIEGDLLEDYFGVVTLGSRAAITTPAYPGRTHRGTVEYVDPRVDPETRTAKVRVAVENPGLALRIGMYMDMSFATAGGRAPVVPKAAMQQIGAMTVAYVPAGEGRFLERAVAALRPGDRVVTSGSGLLRAEALRQYPR